MSRALSRVTPLERTLWAGIIGPLLFGVAAYGPIPRTACSALWAFAALSMSGLIALGTAGLGERPIRISGWSFYPLLVGTILFDLVCIGTVRLVALYASNIINHHRPDILPVIVPDCILLVVVAIFLSRCLWTTSKEHEMYPKHIAVVWFPMIFLLSPVGPLMISMWIFGDPISKPPSDMGKPCTDGRQCESGTCTGEKDNFEQGFCGRHVCGRVIEWVDGHRRESRYTCCW